MVQVGNNNKRCPYLCSLCGLKDFIVLRIRMGLPVEEEGSEYIKMRQEIFTHSWPLFLIVLRSLGVL